MRFKILSLGSMYTHRKVDAGVLVKIKCWKQCGNGANIGSRIYMIMVLVQ